ncbi:MAG: response regulator transcription factor [Clostridia bacterium]|jgi:DNA-binding NarL/FixJ family response regulator|nr:response regulator transcription factor [Clostridia bacterium]
MEKAKIRVLIVDDHPLVREGLREILRAEAGIAVIDEAGDGQGAINMARRLHPDIILMDIKMPGTNGVEATSVIKQELPQTGIIALTVHKEYLLEAVRAGVSGYVLKDIAPAKLVEAIRTVAAGYSVLDPSITQLLFAELNRLMGCHQAQNEGETLTAREEDILKLMARGQSNKEIAVELSISEKTVKNHITNILRKLQVEDRTQAVLFAIKHHLVDL